MLEDNKLVTEDNIARAKDLLGCLERNDEEGAREIIDELALVRETELYQEMGKLTRELHDSISAFGMDTQIVNIAKEEIPDARSRLRHVIKLTDEAANSTLTAVEECVPLCDDLKNRSSALYEKWKRFVQRDMDISEFREMSGLIGQFLEDNTRETEAVRTRLNDILMAQTFQDLTSQIIKRVIALVEDVESNLVNLIKLTGKGNAELDKLVHEEDLLAPKGPPVPGVDKGVVSGQDEVDELLSSLGF